MEERRLLLAVALCLLVFSLYQTFRPHPPLPTASPEATVSPATSTPSTPGPGLPPAAVGAQPAGASASPNLTVVKEANPSEVEVRLPDVTVKLAHVGARVFGWRLLKYKNARGEPMDLAQVRADVPDAPQPLDFETGDVALDRRLRTQAAFVASVPTLELSAKESKSVRFHFAEGNLEAEKTLTFGPEHYTVHVSAFVKRDGQALPLRLVWGPGLGVPDALDLQVQGHHLPQVASKRPGENVARVLGNDMHERRELAGLHWAGIEDTYFTVLLVPPPGNRRATLDTVALPEIKGGATGRGLAEVASGFDSPAHKSPLVAVPLAEGESVQVFAGPKDYPVLAALGSDLKEVVPVGEWLGPIVVPLMALLRWMHGFVGNYGWAIVLLTAMINVIMAPFRHYSIVNGMKMSKLSPEMRAIQERYRKVPLMDPKRAEMQEEINALYARHGMSMSTQMMVGCLPLLLTMPFFIAFYRMLSASIDLRGASFLWIPDLSQKDPLYLTPVLMGLSMAATAFLTPTTADPAQRRMQMLLPIMFVVFLFSAPAGLNVYWLCSNLCGITQQGLTMALLRNDTSPAKARARKKKES